MGMDTDSGHGHGHTCHASEATLSVGFEDVESMRQLLAFKIVNLSDEATLRL
jgi:hypothetical protein